MLSDFAKLANENSMDFSRTGRRGKVDHLEQQLNSSPVHIRTVDMNQVIP
jgi:hypothetical protein